MRALASLATLGALTCALSLLAGCGGHEARTLHMRTALDEGRPQEAVASLNEEMDVKADTDLPKDMEGDNALLVLDRATIQQSLAQFKLSENDFQAADKAVDMLDISHNAADTLGKYVFSDSAGRYQAPPYEKLLINTLNMINYLEQSDLNGARVEARRLAVMHSYFKDKLQDTNPVLGLGGFLAGLTFEKSGEIDEALRWYDTALAYKGFEALHEPVRQILPLGAYRTPRLSALEAEGPPPKPAEGEGEIVVIVGYGRVPHKIAKRIPIGLALTYFAGSIRPDDAAAANRLAAQGLVTWVNYPSLAPGQGSYETPLVTIDRSAQRLEEAVNVSGEVRREWAKLEGPIVASAISRMVVRLAVGEGIRAAGGRGDSTAGVIALIASLGTQATLTALDTPDTRSWETLPARIAIARIRVPAGKHTVHLDARGVSRTQPVDVPAGGWKVVSLMALR